MRRNVLLFDLQFMKFTHMHTPYPSTAGLLLAGYHKAQGDKAMLSTVVPNFAMYDIVYIIKDDLDLYHDPSWLQYPNVVLVGRFWADGLRVWEDEWDEYPPDPLPYRVWVKAWLEKYPHVKANRFAPFFHTPVLIKNKKRILNPSGEILVIDYEPHKIDEDFSTLHGLDAKSLKFLHPVNVSDNPEAAIALLQQRNVMDNKWATVDLDLSEEKLDEVIRLWIEKKVSRTIRLKVWIVNHHEDDWLDSIRFIMPYLERWRNEVGKRVFVEPVDELSFSCPELLYFLRRWTGRDMGYAYNSLLDYAIYDSNASLAKVEAVLTDPITVFEKAKPHRGMEPKVKKLEKIIYFINEHPEFAEMLSKPVIRKGV